jgi:hypothetical protein
VADRPAKVSLAEQLELATKYAPKLRAAGVLTFASGDLALTLAPAAPEPADSDDVTEPRLPKPHTDPLKDRSTYPGGRMPGFSRDPRRA